MVFPLALLLVTLVVACGQSESTTTEGSGGSSSAVTTSTTVAAATTVAASTTVAPDEPIFIEIAAPQDGQSFEVREVRFEGTTLPGATVRAGQFEQKSVDGTWAFDLLLGPNPGELTAVFTAIDSAGNEAKASVTVIYAPVQTTITTTTTTPVSTSTTLEPSP